MERDYYTTPKSSWLMRLMWKACGADHYILERTTYSEQIKYTTLGGIIVATGVMAALAGGYAFYTIFSPRGSAIESEQDISVSIASVVFGLLWGMMIFNLDRFIVSSTGKGDGTEAITWQEFKGAIPRIIMGAIIALTISKPIEIRMFKSEIDTKLHEKQLDIEKTYKEKVDSNYEDRIQLRDKDLDALDQQRAKLEDLLLQTQQKYNEMAGKTVIRYRDRVDSRGNTVTERYEVQDPSIKLLEKSVEKITRQLNEFDERNAEKLKLIQKKKAELEEEKEQRLDDNKKVAAGLDGLLERIHLAHEVAGFWISLFITLLFMAIELTPIFFKLMLVKSPYDFMKENIEEMMKAEQGIQVEYEYFKDKKGVERDLIIHLNKDQIIAEKTALQQAQQELTEYAIARYKEQMKRRIDQNPEDFINSKA